MHYMHYKDYIHHDFYVYSPVLLTQCLGHCWHTPCTELYILRIRCNNRLGCWENPPSPATGGGEPSGWGRGGCGGPCSYIHIYIHIYIYTRKYIYMHIYIRHLAQATAAKRWRASSGLAHCAWSVFPYPSFSICWHMLWARGVPPA